MTIARRNAAHAKRDADKSGLNPHDALVLLTADRALQPLIRTRAQRWSNTYRVLARRL